MVSVSQGLRQTTAPSPIEAMATLLLLLLTLPFAKALATAWVARVQGSHLATALHVGLSTEVVLGRAVVQGIRPATMLLANLQG